eukprot:1868605-Rhodomonas_salina.1
MSVTSDALSHLCNARSNPGGRRSDQDQPPPHPLRPPQRRPEGIYSHNAVPSLTRMHGRACFSVIAGWLTSGHACFSQRCVPGHGAPWSLVQEFA